MTDLSGQYLGRYYLSERLGEGGMAVVYKAFDTRLERDVAIKIIRSGAFPADALGEVLKRFEREAKSLAKLSHPNIVKVYDYGEHEGEPYLVMEYLPGGTIKKMLGKPVPWQDAVRLILPVARGVAYAHQRGILHRDIKPANVLITDGGEPMLSDFGIAKLFEGEQTTALTGSGMAIGTPEYMAPEQWTGNTSPQSDLYSLGIVLYELVTGRKPYVADTPAAILIKQVTEPLPNPRRFVVDIPDALEHVLIKVLARESDDRYQDVNAFISALENLHVSVPIIHPAEEQGIEEKYKASFQEPIVSIPTQLPNLDSSAIGLVEETQEVLTETTDSVKSKNEVNIREQKPSPRRLSEKNPIQLRPIKVGTIVISLLVLVGIGSLFSKGSGFLISFATPTPTLTFTQTTTFTPTVTITPSETPKPSLTPTKTYTVTFTFTPTVTSTITNTPIPPCPGGNVSGSWSGSATTGNEKRTYSMTLNQTGCQVSGSSFTSGYGSAYVTGSVSNGVFSFSESGSPGSCYFSGSLRINGNRMTGKDNKCGAQIVLTR